MNQKISVIMPVYNSEKYLSVAIESVLKQTYSNFELIIINDGSTDGSADIIQNYARTEPRIRILNNFSNRGLIHSLNLGLQMASGEYIARMDADDVSLPERFANQVAYLNLHQDIFLIAGSFYIIDEFGNRIGSKSNEYFPSDVENKLLRFGAIHHPTVMFRNTKDLFYREKAKHAEDRDLWLRLISLGKKLYVSPEYVLEYRLHESSVSTVNAEFQKKILEEVLKWHQQRKHSDKDDYDHFDQDSIKISSNDYKRTNQERVIKNSFLRGDSDLVTRQQVRGYIKSEGYLSSLQISFLYFLYFLPFVFVSLTKKLLLKKWS